MILSTLDLSDMEEMESRKWREEKQTVQEGKRRKNLKLLEILDRIGERENCKLYMRRSYNMTTSSHQPGSPKNYTP